MALLGQLCLEFSPSDSSSSSRVDEPDDGIPDHYDMPSGRCGCVHDKDCNEALLSRSSSEGCSPGCDTDVQACTPDRYCLDSGFVVDGDPRASGNSACFPADAMVRVRGNDDGTVVSKRMVDIAVGSVVEAKPGVFEEFVWWSHKLESGSHMQVEISAGSCVVRASPGHYLYGYVVGGREQEDMSLVAAQDVMTGESGWAKSSKYR
ncbi:expressed unknown protein [Seminavis robusta]|uniref:Uncharacterized protein n=1 Tax=Seminavis robusta TaxID=568900 RepID=A0A9N8H473_9STRA|nr:expressed unknown protein [Seminavis robusta]|eukprot:Sro55_g032250.1 n/a (206) ;mRNA; r:42166-42783